MTNHPSKLIKPAFHLFSLTASLLLGVLSPGSAQPPGWNDTIVPSDYGLPPSAIDLRVVDCVVTVFSSTDRPTYTYWIKGVVGFDRSRPVYDFLNDLYLSITTESHGMILPFTKIKESDRGPARFDFQPDRILSLPTSRHGLHIAMGTSTNNRLIAQVYHRLSPNYAVQSSSNLCYIGGR